MPGRVQHQATEDNGGGRGAAGRAQTDDGRGRAETAESRSNRDARSDSDVSVTVDETPGGGRGLSLVDILSHALVATDPPLRNISARRLFALNLTCVVIYAVFPKILSSASGGQRHVSLAASYNELLHLIAYTSALFRIASLGVHVSTRKRCAHFVAAGVGGLAVFSALSVAEPTSLRGAAEWSPQSFALYGMGAAMCGAILVYAASATSNRTVLLAKFGAIGLYLAGAYAVGWVSRVEVHVHHWIIAWLVRARVRECMCVRVFAAPA